MHHSQNLREIARQLTNAGWLKQADQCEDAAVKMDQLTATVAKLDKTGDGVPITKGMTVFSLDAYGKEIFEWIVAPRKSIDLIDPNSQQLYTDEDITGIYSTREAIERAKPTVL